MDIPCFPHVISNVAERIEVPLAVRFVRTFASLMSFSANARQVFRVVTGQSFCTYSSTRWFSLVQTATQLLRVFPDVPAVLDRCQQEGYGMPTSLRVGYVACARKSPRLDCPNLLSYHLAFDHATGEKTVHKVLDDLTTVDKLAQLLVELAILVDVAEPLSYACYKLEGDGPLALYVSEIWTGAVQYQLRCVIFAFSWHGIELSYLLCVCKELRGLFQA
jgi:hypothetical protein